MESRPPVPPAPAAERTLTVRHSGLAQPMVLRLTEINSSVVWKGNLTALCSNIGVKPEDAAQTKVWVNRFDSPEGKSLLLDFSDLQDLFRSCLEDGGTASGLGLDVVLTTDIADSEVDDGALARASTAASGAKSKDSKRSAASSQKGAFPAVRITQPRWCAEWRAALQQLPETKDISPIVSYLLTNCLSGTYLIQQHANLALDISVKVRIT